MSMLMIVAVIAGRSILLSAHFRSPPDLSIENKRRSLVSKIECGQLDALLPGLDSGMNPKLES